MNGLGSLVVSGLCGLVASLLVMIQGSLIVLQNQNRFRTLFVFLFKLAPLAGFFLLCSKSGARVPIVFMFCSFFWLGILGSLKSIHLMKNKRRMQFIKK